MADFHNVRLPEDIERGAEGGPSFKTDVTTLSSGIEKRNRNWNRSRMRYDIGYGIQELDQLENVQAFFYARYGRAHGFRFKDWLDYVITNQQIAVGDGTTKAFQIYRTYVDISSTYARKITRPVAGTVTVRVDGVNTTFTENMGVVTLVSTPELGQIITVTCEFDVPVRFDTDELSVTANSEYAGTVNSIPIIEILE